jgi:pyridoxal phosphate enzyme (YggS family)
MLTGPQNSSAAQTIESGRPFWEANLEATRRRIVEAAQLSGREPDQVHLLTVSKQQSADIIRKVAAAGQRDFGENYLQEALEKIRSLAGLNLTWHYIGQIQSNKTRPIAESFQWVHTVDRLKIAERLSEQRSSDGSPLNVCIQVKLAEEPGKGGATTSELKPLAESIIKLPRLRLRGLMCIPPPRDHFDEQVAYFRQCAELLHELNACGMTLDTLSMGMSADLEAAIAAGATIVRVGTAIFGARKSIRDA